MNNRLNQNVLKSEDVWLIEKSREWEQMRGFLINKNLCFYYWLRKKIGKKQAYRVSNSLEKVILIFGREPIL